MKQARDLMGTIITVEIADAQATVADFDAVFDYFGYVDQTFSTYKKTSEISRINQQLIAESDYSSDMKEIFRAADETKRLTNGYFDIVAADGTYDPSGIVKGWSIYHAARLLRERGFKNFYVDAGGDIEVVGRNGSGQQWTVGIRDPFAGEDKKKIIKVLYIDSGGVATSGTYIRGQHIYNPFQRDIPLTEIVSLTVIGPNIYEADRFATAAFAMGRGGINFIEQRPGLEGYMIDRTGVAVMTSGFERYTQPHA